jgi:hypothetical protein
MTPGQGGSGFQPLPDPPKFEGGRSGHDADRGLYKKFDVQRTDGRDAPGEMHDGCRYFVLDLDHDPHARHALRAYAESCRDTEPALASDLDQITA